MSWRDRYTQLIARVISDNAGQPLAKVRKKLREAFPDGPREYHPYKIWLDECRVQLGLKPVKPKRVPLVKPPIPSAPGQKTMFN